MTEAPPTFKAMYQQFWSLKGYLEHDLQNTLQEASNILLRLHSARTCGVSVRKKDIDSLWSRFKKTKPCSRGEFDKAFEREDVLGGRLTVLNLCDIRPAVEVTRMILEDREWKFIKLKDHIETPTTGGHRAIHLYFARNGVPTEVQVLTEPSDFWSRWNHFLTYKSKFAPPASHIEQQFSQGLSIRLWGIDEEANKFRLELQYYRTAKPKEILDDPPTTSVKYGAPPEWIKKILKRNLEWLFVPDSPLPAQKVWLGYNDKPFGFPSTGESKSPAGFFEIDRDIDEKEFFACADRMGLPNDASQLAHQTLTEIYSAKRSSGKSDTFFNGPLARLEAFVGSGDTLKLWLRETSYWTLLLTNLAFEPAVAGVTCTPLNDRIKELFKNEKISPQARLANNMAVHITLLTSDNYALLVKRGGQATQGGLWSNSASGDLFPRKWDNNKRGDLIPLLDSEKVSGRSGVVVSPFLGAARELAEEIGVEVPISDIEVQALVRTKEHRQPILLLEAKTDLKFEEIERMAPSARDRWENHQLFELPANERGMKLLVAGHNGLPSIVKEPGKWQLKAVASILLSINKNCQRP
jgi:ppGpp synthetase/RelA/SpoT-type nucleotidyltranferase